MTKKVNVFGKILCIAAVLALVGVVVYIVNSSVGYLAGTGMNTLTVLLPLIVIACSLVLIFVPNIINDTITGIITFLLSVGMGYAVVTFVVARIDLIADLLNPVNHPANEYTAFTWTCVGLVLYVLAFLGTLIATMGTRLAKKKK